MKKMLSALAGSMALVPVVATAAVQLCASQAAIVKVDDEPAITKNAWSIYVYIPKTQLTIWLTSDPRGTINLDTAKGSSVFALAMAAYTAQSTVSVYDNTGSSCGSFDQIVLQPAPPPVTQ